MDDWIIPNWCCGFLRNKDWKMTSVYKVPHRGAASLALTDTFNIILRWTLQHENPVQISWVE